MVGALSFIKKESKAKYSLGIHDLNLDRLGETNQQTKKIGTKRRTPNRDPNNKDAATQK
jgi:hypothetical protein